MLKTRRSNDRSSSILNTGGSSGMQVLGNVGDYGETRHVFKYVGYWREHWQVLRYAED